MQERGKVDPAMQEDWEERAAIMEYDGGLSRPLAEALAWMDVRKRWTKNS